MLFFFPKTCKQTDNERGSGAEFELTIGKKKTAISCRKNRKQKGKKKWKKAMASEAYVAKKKSSKDL